MCVGCSASGHHLGTCLHTLTHNISRRHCASSATSSLPATTYHCHVWVLALALSPPSALPPLPTPHRLFSVRLRRSTLLRYPTTLPFTFACPRTRARCTTPHLVPTPATTATPRSAWPIIHSGSILLNAAATRAGSLPALPARCTRLLHTALPRADLAPPATCDHGHDAGT